MSNEAIKEIFSEATDLINNREYDKAAKHIEKVLNSSKDENLACLLAKVYFYLENSSKAVKLLEKVLKNDPNNHLAMYLLARVKYHLMDKKTEAIELVLKALKLANDNSFYYSLGALIYFKLNNSNRALKLANDALFLNENNYEALCVLAANYQNENDEENSDKTYIKALNMAPSFDNKEFYFNSIFLDLAKTKKGYQLIKDAYLLNADFDYY
ncbi:MAG: tetratricopeptide repeat protein [Vampirovibrionia bacterium]